MKVQKKLIASMVGIIACAASLSLFAEEPLEEVVVTALKRGTSSVVEASAAIDVVTGSEIEDMGANSIEDFLQMSPGVSLDAGSENGQTSIQIRGVNSPFGASTVGFYMDDLPYSLIRINTLPSVPVFDLEQVEVLRGPQGTLYGAGSAGGVVVVKTQNPEMNEFGGKLDLSFGDTEGGGSSYVTSAAINVPLIDDVLAARAVVTWQDDNGWADDAFSGEKNVNDSDKLDARLKVLFEPTEDLSMTFLAAVSRSDSFGMGTVTDESGDTFSVDPFIDITVFPPIFIPNGGDVSETAVNYEQYGFTVSYDFGGFSVFNALSYIDLDIYRPFFYSASINDSNSESFVNEFRLSSNGDGRFNWLFGVFYRDTEETTTVLRPPLPVVTVDDVLTSEQLSFFGEVSYEVIEEKLTVSAGVSVFDDEVVYDIGYTPNFAPLGFVDQTLENDTDLVSPQATISYHHSEDSTLFFRWAEGFRSGVFDSGTSIILNRLALMDPTFDGRVNAEEITSYELGYKTEFMDGDGYFEVVLFRNELENTQQLGILPLPALGPGAASGTVFNAGDARSQGFELLVNVSPVDGLDLSFSTTHTDANLTEDVIQADGQTTYPDGTPLTLVPSWTVSGSASYAWDVSASWQAVVSGNVQHTSKKTLAQPLAPGIVGDSTTLLNLRAEVGPEDWSVYAFINNVTDEDGAVTPFETFLAGNPTGGRFANRYQPRTYGLGVRYSY